MGETLGPINELKLEQKHLLSWQNNLCYLFLQFSRKIQEKEKKFL